MWLDWGPGQHSVAMVTLLSQNLHCSCSVLGLQHGHCHLGSERPFPLHRLLRGLISPMICSWAAPSISTLFSHTLSLALLGALALAALSAWKSSPRPTAWLLCSRHLLWVSPRLCWPRWWESYLPTSVFSLNLGQ